MTSQAAKRRELAESVAPFIYVNQEALDFCDAMTTIANPVHDHRMCYRMYCASMGDEVPLVQQIMALSQYLDQEEEDTAQKPRVRLEDVLLKPLGTCPPLAHQAWLDKNFFEFRKPAVFAYPAVPEKPVKYDATHSVEAFMLMRQEHSAPKTTYSKHIEIC